MKTILYEKLKNDSPNKTVYFERQILVRFDKKSLQNLPKYWNKSNY